MSPNPRFAANTETIRSASARFVRGGERINQARDRFLREQVPTQAFGRSAAAQRIAGRVTEAAQRRASALAATLGQLDDFAGRLVTMADDYDRVEADATEGIKAEHPDSGKSSPISSALAPGGR
ncbi:hypothetical protein EV191_1011422 [Tamaricihabitans halophyticus]|uniref:Excreted virulence factor EspC (Type VII ESX diderm) n=1 Tax=Tamaricihabitans halophyticus TaxID=1262583 RepID=A0A4V6NRG9_9PSEU|nr:hypothetical protein [Tamaricihabitans halophyticus]TCP57466.1 hypothetical protein EV191_1011422 [Tamaricihabitans halophyticus]